MKKIFFRSIFLSVIGLSLQSIPHVQAVEYEERWSHFWGGSNTESFMDIIELKDGGVVAIGTTDSTDTSTPTHGKSDGLLVKYNQNGTEEWSTSWGTSGSDTFSIGTPTSDGGFVVTGKTYVANKYWDIVTIKYDANGQQQWIQTFGGSDWDEPDNVLETKDGGIAVLGSVYAGGLSVESHQSGNLACVIKYDRNGTQQWVKFLGRSGYQYAGDFIELEDGSFIVQGHEEVAPDYDNAFAFLWKVDAQGHLIWEKEFGETGWNSFDKIAKTNDGGFVTVGGFIEDTFSNNGSNDYKKLIAKFDEDGSLIWHQYLSDQSVLISDLKVDRTGAIIVAGEETDATNNTNGFLAKYQQDGSEEWQLSCGGSGYEMIYFIELTANNEIVASGTTGSNEAPFYSKGGADVFFINLNSDGDILSLHTIGGEYRDSVNNMTITKNNAVFLVGTSRLTNSPIYNAPANGLIVKYEPKSDKDIQIDGNIQSTLVSISVPSEPLSFVINPNLEYNQQFISPLWTIQNETNAPLTLSIKSFSQTSNTLTDVLPNYYNSWERLSLKESQFIALSLNSSNPEGWLQQDNSVVYVADSQNKLLGTIKPRDQVNLSFSALHGQSFNQTLTLQYKLTFIFDLLSTDEK